MLFSASLALSRNPWKHLAAEPKNTQSPINQERPTTGKWLPPVCLSRSAVRSDWSKARPRQQASLRLSKWITQSFLNAQNHPCRWQHTGTYLMPSSQQTSFLRCRSRTLLPSNAHGVYQAARRLFDKTRTFRPRMAALSCIAPRKWKISFQECRCTILR